MPQERPDHDTILSTVKSVRGIVDNIAETLKFQILPNADTATDELSHSEEREKTSLLIENMIKKPIRRSIGRLNGISRTLTEVETKLKIVEKAQHGK